MKRSTKLFWRTVYVSVTVMICIIVYIFGIAVSFENIRKTAFGEERKAVEINGDEIKILDFSFVLSESEKGNDD